MANDKFKVSNLLLNQPILASAKQYDLIMLVGLLLQNKVIDDDIEEHIIINTSRQEVLEKLQINKSINTGYIDNLFYSLRSKEIKYSEQNSCLSASLLSVYKRENNDIVLHIYKDIALLFLELKNKYTYIDFDIITKLKSVYAKKIYLLCLQYRHLQSWRDFYIDELKEVLSVEEKYVAFHNFKNRCLLVASEDINNLLPDMNFKFYLIKNGKRNEKIKFTFDFSFIEEKKSVAQMEVEEEQKLKERKEPFKTEKGEPKIYKSKRLKFTPPTREDIFLYIAISGKFINPDIFISHYEAQGWRMGTGIEVENWKSLVNKWFLKQTKAEQEDAVRLYQKWEDSYSNETRYSEVIDKLKEINIDDEEFAKALVDNNMEKIFDFENGKFFRRYEYEAKYNQDLSNTAISFIAKYSKYEKEFNGDF